MEQQVVAVLGYGCQLTQEMGGYLYKVAAFVQSRSVDQRVACVIVSGGYTNLKTKPNVSEAEMMRASLEKRFQERGVCRIIKDETPIDTRGNLQGIERIRKEQGLEHLPLVIFCDGVHAPKIRLFSLLLHRSWPKIKTHSLTKGLLPKLKHLFVVTALEMGALVIPYMERRRFERRKRIVANS